MPGSTQARRTVPATGLCQRWYSSALRKACQTVPSTNRSAVSSPASSSSTEYGSAFAQNSSSRWTRLAIRYGVASHGLTTTASSSGDATGRSPS